MRLASYLHRATRPGRRNAARVIGVVVALALTAIGAGLVSAVDPSQPIISVSFEPRVVDAGRSDPVAVTVQVGAGVTSVSIVSLDGTSTPLAAATPETYVGAIASSQLLGYEADAACCSQGFIDIYGTTGRLVRYNLGVPVRRRDMPDVPIQQLAADVQASAHIVNIRWETSFFGSSVPTDVLRRFYDFFGDTFDFVSIVEPLQSVHNRNYQAVRNDTLGLGLAPFDNGGAAYGSAKRLQGIIDFPIDGLFDLGSVGAVHEIGHRWMNYLTQPLLAGGSHWPMSDLASAVIGFSIPPTGEGGDFPFTLIAQPNGDYIAHWIPRDQFVRRGFNDLELYLMGLIPAAEVQPHFVFRNQDISQLPTTAADGVLSGPVDQVSIEDIVRADGPRIPAFGTAQTSFRMATVVLSQGRLLSASEMAYFDYMAARGEVPGVVDNPAGIALAGATGGRANLSTTLGPARVPPTASASVDALPTRLPSSISPSESASPSSAPAPTEDASNPVSAGTLLITVSVIVAVCGVGALVVRRRRRGAANVRGRGKRVP